MARNGDGLFRRDGIWYFKYKDPGGVYREKSTGKKKQPQSLAFLYPPSAAGAAAGPDRRSFGLVACCATPGKRSKSSSRRIPRQPHSEASHGP